MAATRKTFDVAKATPSQSRPQRAPIMRHLLPRSEGTRYRQLTLVLDASGGLTLTWREMGVTPEAAWGADDNEVTLHVRGEDAARLTFALLSERLEGRPDGLDDLLALCARNNVEHQLARWT